MSLYQTKPTSRRLVTKYDPFTHGEYNPRASPSIGTTQPAHYFGAAYSGGIKLLKAYGYYNSVKKFLPDYYVNQLYNLVSNPKAIFKKQDFWRIMNAIQQNALRPQSKISKFQRNYPISKKQFRNKTAGVCFQS